MNFDNIYSIILFGSYATYEINNNSDIDVCIIVDDSVDYKLNKKELSDFIGVDKGCQKLSSVIYPLSKIKLMLESGSLFLWHLKLEGKVLYGKDFFTKEIKKLKRYNEHIEELNYIKEIFEQLKSSYEKSNLVTSFDYSLMYSMVRNSCIVICDYYDNPKYGKLNCYLKAKELLPDLPVTSKQYNELYNFKVLYEKINDNHVDYQKSISFNEYIEILGSTIDFCLNKINKKYA